MQLTYSYDGRAAATLRQAHEALLQAREQILQDRCNCTKIPLAAADAAF
jgi:hypothetical protein